MTKEQKDKIAKKESRELKKIFSNVEPDKKRFVDGLINQVAFMSATLAELNENINENGAIQVSQNGNGFNVRSDLDLKNYNATIKSYNATVKQLIDMLPVTEEIDELTEFMNARNRQGVA